MFARSYIPRASVVPVPRFPQVPAGDTGTVTPALPPPPVAAPNAYTTAFSVPVLASPGFGTANYAQTFLGPQGGLNVFSFNPFGGWQSHPSSLAHNFGN